MQNPVFIRIDTVTESGDISVRYVNKNHIQQIYEKNGIIFVELTDYITLEVHDENILIFMDRFVQ